MSGLYAAVEAGGTKFVCAVFAAGRCLDGARVATRDPGATLAEVFGFFDRVQARHGALASLGIASFGPLRLDPSASDHGRLLTTPKPGWAGFDLLGAFRCRYRLPTALDTDVNAAALAERQWGAGRGLDDLAYVTVGTGIGGGLVMASRPVHGLLHAELGHLRPRRHPGDAGFAGLCPFHGDCFEGLASGPAIAARSGAPAVELPAEHPVWEIEADYLGQLCAQIALTASPRRIVLGGGVMQRRALFPLIRERMRHWLGGYLPDLSGSEATADYVVPPALGAHSGLFGALLLALQAAGEPPGEAAPGSSV